MDLYISTGPSPTPTPKPTATPKPVAVPDLKGVPEADAVAELNDVGLLVGERTHKNNDSVASGAVIKSDPVAGTKVPPGSKVDLVVSKGPAPTPTPKPTPIADAHSVAHPLAQAGLHPRCRRAAGGGRGDHAHR